MDSKSQGCLGSKKRRRESPSGDTSMGPKTQQQTSLPSIRQLHPYLPPLPGNFSPDYGHSQPSAFSHFPPHSEHVDSCASEECDDADERNPPKKKRRRQPLSCTECQRRKIKCDRIQPCAPCSSRGEEAICKWAIVEPVRGKYATTEEIDDLKARFEQLAALVRRALPDFATGIPSHQMGLQPTRSLVARVPIQSYSSGASTYSGQLSLMPRLSQSPQRRQPYSRHPETSSPGLNVCVKAKGVQSPIHAPSPYIGASSSALHDLPLPLHQPENSHTLATAVVKAFPLSSASVTSPYRPGRSQQGRSEDLQGQALISGECLRPELEDPPIYQLRHQWHRNISRCSADR